MIITNILSTITRRVNGQANTMTKNFFDYPAREKKKIIKSAARDANKLQKNLIARHRVIAG